MFSTEQSGSKLVHFTENLQKFPFSHARLPENGIYESKTIRLDSSTSKRDAGKIVGIPFKLFCPSACADKYL